MDALIDTDLFCQQTLTEFPRRQQDFDTRLMI